MGKPNQVLQQKKVGENICLLIEQDKEDQIPDFLGNDEQDGIFKNFDEEFDNFSSKKDKIMGFIDFEEEEVFFSYHIKNPTQNRF